MAVTLESLGNTKWGSFVLGLCVGLSVGAAIGAGSVDGCPVGGAVPDTGGARVTDTGVGTGLAPRRHCGSPQRSLLR